MTTIAFLYGKDFVQWLYSNAAQLHKQFQKEEHEKKIRWDSKNKRFVPMNEPEPDLSRAERRMRELSEQYVDHYRDAQRYVQQPSVPTVTAGYPPEGSMVTVANQPMTATETTIRNQRPSEAERLERARLRFREEGFDDTDATVLARHLIQAENDPMARERLDMEYRRCQRHQTYVRNQVRGYPYPGGIVNPGESIDRLIRDEMEGLRPTRRRGTARTR